MSLRGWILLTWILMPLAGCASLTDFHYEQTQRARARAAWHEHGVATTPATYASDYRAGWKDGFYDVATGGKGCPPVVAPCHYWQPAQILVDCDQARHAYYSGFQDGVAAALQYPQTHYLKLWSSCECPLPVCENRCATAVCCPSGPCGLIIQDEFPGAAEHFVPQNSPIQPVEGPGAIQEAVPYQFDADQVQAVPAGSSYTQGAALPEAQPRGVQKGDAVTQPRPFGIEAAQPYHFDARRNPSVLTPLESTGAEFPGHMIEADRCSVAPCNLLQYAD